VATSSSPFQSRSQGDEDIAAPNPFRKGAVSRCALGGGCLKEEALSMNMGRAHAKTRRREEGGGANPSIDGDVAGESKAGWKSNGNPRDPRSALSARLCGLSDSGSLALSGDREAIGCGGACGKGFCRRCRGWLLTGDETQRSRAGLSSAGPPGLGPRLGHLHAAEISRRGAEPQRATGNLKRRQP
jgi:hypothetical protein